MIRAVNKQIWTKKTNIQHSTILLRCKSHIVTRCYRQIKPNNWGISCASLYYCQSWSFWCICDIQYSTQMLFGYKSNVLSWAVECQTFLDVGRCFCRTLQIPSQDQAATPLFPLPHLQRCPCGHFKYFPHPILGLGWALQVTKGTNAVGHVTPFLWFYRLLKSDRYKRDVGGL